MREGGRNSKTRRGDEIRPNEILRVNIYENEIPSARSGLSQLRTKEILRQSDRKEKDTKL